MQYSATPAPQGLYDPQFERDACGVAAVADIKGRRSHSIVADGVTALINLDHRGAAGADPAVGDGAGILFQVPDELLRDTAGFPLPVSPDPRHGQAYAVGVAFLPADDAGARRGRSGSPPGSWQRRAWNCWAGGSSPPTRPGPASGGWRWT